MAQMTEPSIDREQRARDQTGCLKFEEIGARIPNPDGSRPAIYRDLRRFL